MRLIVLFLALVCIAGAAQAQIVFGPGDTVKIPLELMDSINNPAAVDSAADSVLVRVIKNFAANSSGADTCYLHRGLMDASTNSLLHTTGNATTTLGFGSVPKRVQTFSFFATAYTLTNSATASGTYTIEVWTYDASLGLITTRKIPFNYIYFGASTGTYAMWADSVGSMARWAMKTLAPDSTTAGYQKVDVFSVAATAQTARDLGAQLDSATSKVGIGDNAIGSGELATTAVAEILHYKIDTVTLSDSSIAGFAYMALKPTTALRKLDVSSTGEAGVDWANIGSPTTTVNLSGTTIATTQQVNATKIGGTTQTGIDIGSYLPAAMDSVMLSNGYRAGQKAIFKVSANLDTLYIYSRDGSTLLFRTVFVHPGGSPGDPPDTSRSVGP